MVKDKKDLVIIGGGPAGYVAAIRSAQAGADTALIECDKVGGTCLNVGCISTKVLAKTAEIFTQAGKLDTYGINVGKPGLDYATVQNRKDEVVEVLTGGVGVLLENYGVEVIKGEAAFKAPKRIEVSSSKKFLIDSDKVIIATGAKPMELPALPFDSKNILHSTDLLNLKQLPESLLVVGGGVVGVEFASIMNQFGVKVTLIEMLPHLLPNLDIEISKALLAELEAQNIEVRTGTKVDQVKINGGKVIATLSDSDSQNELAVEKVLVAAGRVPHVESLNLKAAGISTEKGAIKVNAKMETGVPGIYAAGDVCGGYQLASVAYHEGAIAAANANGSSLESDLRAMPYCIFTNPEVAGLGLTEEQARKKYPELIVKRFPFSANGKALAAGTQNGLIKIVAEPVHHEILGFFIIGPSATELIHQAAQVMKMEGVVDDLAAMVYGHPTLSEAVGEVALMGMNKPLHMI